MVYIIFQVAFFLVDIIYMFIKLCPTQHKVVFLSRQSNKPSSDMLDLKKQLNKEDSTLKLVFLCRTLDGGIKGKISYIFHMFSQMYHIATSEVAVLDSYCIVISCLHHKKNLKVIQMWHGLGSFKKFGYSILGKEEGSSLKIAKAMHMHEKYDYVLTSSKKTMAYFQEGFNADPRQMTVAPLPKVDLLRNENYKQTTKDEILSEYEQLKTKENVLYIPTFRKDEQLQKEKIQELIAGFDFKKFNLIISLHPISKIQLDDERVIQNKKYNSIQWSCVCDKVITDYSAVVYEMAICDKQIYYYVYDLKEYINNRGFYVSLDEFPGPKCETVASLMTELSNENYDQNSVRNFISEYVDLSIDNCCHHICDIIRNYPKV